MSAISLPNVRPLAVGIAAAIVFGWVPAAHAMPIEPKGSKASEGQSSVTTVTGDTKSDLPSSSKASEGQSSVTTVTGDTKSDLPSSSTAKAGDTPVDFPGATRAPEAPATIVTIERPRVVVDDTDDALPIVLSGLALLVALGGTGYTVARRSPLPRPSR